MHTLLCFSRTAEGPWPLRGKVSQDSARVAARRPFMNHSWLTTQLRCNAHDLGLCATGVHAAGFHATGARAASSDGATTLSMATFPPAVCAVWAADEGPGLSLLLQEEEEP